MITSRPHRCMRCKCGYTESFCRIVTTLDKYCTLPINLLQELTHYYIRYSVVNGHIHFTDIMQFKQVAENLERELISLS